MATMEEAIDYAYSQGVVMVAAAGNRRDTDPHYPAYYDNMMSVAATNSNDDKASFSTYGDWVDIAAPGVDILSLLYDYNYSVFNCNCLICNYALLISL